jgi:NADH-quinone oxidoreductase subunit G
MSDDLVNLEVNGESVQARKGQMLIEVTDANEVYVPRFCYHEKLSIAANCRMCLVEVEKAPKPLPACATPVAEGMKVFTKSPRAISAQKATMEFLLVNHPLDCPICDQGGECELQDLSVGYGSDVSRYTERKRVVKDKNLGPLVSTDMTRCIHCTRCVRFGQEIQGIQQLGTVGRGDRMEISTYVERSVDHELSGNIIDLCPVGALNNKPYRFSARAWEMTQHASISAHDCVGSNLYFHVQNGHVKRAVPRDNEAVNETWLSDRDRFSCHAVEHNDRLLRPRIKENGEWRDCEWVEALEHSSTLIQGLVKDKGAQSLGILASSCSTLEEAALLGKIAQGLGTSNIDHRCRMVDFRDQKADSQFPSLGRRIAQLEELNSILVVGSNLRSEAPILAHRVRKAALAGASVSFLSTEKYEYLFPVTAYLDHNAGSILANLAALVAAAAELTAKPVPAHVAAAVAGGKFTEQHKAIVSSLMGEGESAIVLGLQAVRHAAWADVRALAGALSQLTGASLGELSEGANSAGASLAGVLPHRSAGGAVREVEGLNALQMMQEPRSAYLLASIEPGADLVADGAVDALKAADAVIVMASFVSEELLACADVLLPVGTVAETSGTFVNVEGRWQSFAGAARPLGESRPAWKVLRVLGNLLDLEGFDYDSSEEIRDELLARVGEGVAASTYQGDHVAAITAPDATRDIPMYAVDGLVRRSLPLQQTGAGLPLNTATIAAEVVTAEAGGN